MMEKDTISFMLGELTASVNALTNRIGGVESSVKTLNDHMNQSKGGLRMLLLMCSISGVIGGALTTLIQWIISRPHL